MTNITDLIRHGVLIWLYTVCSCLRIFRVYIKLVSDGNKWASVSGNCMYLRECAPSEGSDQTALSHSLIRIFAERILDNQGCKVSSCGQPRLWSDSADAQADFSLRWAHTSEGPFSQVDVHIIMLLNRLSFLNYRFFLSRKAFLTRQIKEKTQFINYMTLVDFRLCVKALFYVISVIYWQMSCKMTYDANLAIISPERDFP